LKPRRILQARAMQLEEGGGLPAKKDEFRREKPKQDAFPTGRGHLFASEKESYLKKKFQPTNESPAGESRSRCKERRISGKRSEQRRPSVRRKPPAEKKEKKKRAEQTNVERGQQQDIDGGGRRVLPHAKKRGPGA